MARSCKSSGSANPKPLNPLPSKLLPRVGSLSVLKDELVLEIKMLLPVDTIDIPVLAINNLLVKLLPTLLTPIIDEALVIVSAINVLGVSSKFLVKNNPVPAPAILYNSSKF